MSSIRDQYEFNWSVRVILYLVILNFELLIVSLLPSIAVFVTK